MTSSLFTHRRLLAKPPPHCRPSPPPPPPVPILAIAQCSIEWFPHYPNLTRPWGIPLTVMTTVIPGRYWQLVETPYDPSFAITVSWSPDPGQLTAYAAYQQSGFPKITASGSTPHGPPLQMPFILDWSLVSEYPADSVYFRFNNATPEPPPNG